MRRLRFRSLPPAGGCANLSLTTPAGSALDRRPVIQERPVSQTLVATARTGGQPPLRGIASPVLRIFAAAIEALAEAQQLRAEAERRYRYLNFDC
jgi:hypothetical protein